jgi:hypothetical protein
LLPDGGSGRFARLCWVLRLEPLVILLILVAVLRALSPVFATTANVGNVLAQSAGIAVLAVGQLLAILTRGIDLSVGLAGGAPPRGRQDRRPPRVLGNPSLDDRVKAMLDTLGTKAKVVAKVATDCDQTKGLNAAQDILSAHPDIDGIYSACGPAVGAMRVAPVNLGFDRTSTGEDRRGSHRRSDHQDQTNDRERATSTRGPSAPGS